MEIFLHLVVSVMQNKANFPLKIFRATFSSTLMRLHFFHALIGESSDSIDGKRAHENSHKKVMTERCKKCYHRNFWSVYVALVCILVVKQENLSLPLSKQAIKFF